MALVIEEMQMKTTLRHHLGYVIWNIASLGMAIKKKKKRKITSVWKDVEKLEPLCIAGGNVKWYHALEHNLVFPQKVKHGITI